MRHGPGHGSFLEVARDKKLRFVRVARFLPDAFLMWIAPGEHLLDGIEGRYRVVWRMAGEAGREAIPAGCRIVENRGFGNTFGHDQILPRYAGRSLMSRPVPIENNLESVRHPRLVLSIAPITGRAAHAGGATMAGVPAVSLRPRACRRDPHTPRVPRRIRGKQSIRSRVQRSSGGLLRA